MGKKDVFYVNRNQSEQFDFILLGLDIFLLLITQSNLFLIYALMMMMRILARNSLPNLKGEKSGIREFTMKKNGLGIVLLLAVATGAFSVLSPNEFSITNVNNIFESGKTFLSKTLGSSFDVSNISALPFAKILTVLTIIIFAIQENQFFAATLPFLFIKRNTSKDTRAEQRTRPAAYALSILIFSVWHLIAYGRELSISNSSFFAAALFGSGFLYLSEKFNTSATGSFAHAAVNLANRTVRLIGQIFGV